MKGVGGVSTTFLNPPSGFLQQKNFKKICALEVWYVTILVEQTQHFHPSIES